MPKLTNSLPKYHKHKASGQAVTTICGKDFYLGPHGTLASKREYDRLIAEYLASGRSPVFGKPAEVLTVTQLAVAYIKHAKTYFGTAPIPSMRTRSIPATTSMRSAWLTWTQLPAPPTWPAAATAPAG